jgi:hypothetical protein
MKALMWVTLISGVLLAGTAVAATPQAGDDGSNPDACGAALCLIGKTRDDDCNNYISKYFGIEKTKHGHFDPSKTKKARWKWLQQCKDDTVEKQQANDTWGPVKRGF